MVYSLRQFTVMVVVLSYITIWDMGTWLYVLNTPVTNRRSSTSQAATAINATTQLASVQPSHDVCTLI